MLVVQPELCSEWRRLNLESKMHRIGEFSHDDVEMMAFESGKDEDGRVVTSLCENVVVDGCTVFKGHKGFVVGRDEVVE